MWRLGFWGLNWSGSTGGRPITFGAGDRLQEQRRRECERATGGMSPAACRGPFGVSCFCAADSQVLRPAAEQAQKHHGEKLGVARRLVGSAGSGRAVAVILCRCYCVLLSTMHLGRLLQSSAEG